MIYCFEIFIHLASGYFEMGMLITDRKHIFLNYLKKTMVFDLLAIVSLLFRIVGQTSTE